jgi:hypothetical protein
MQKLKRIIILSSLTLLSSAAFSYNRWAAVDYAWRYVWSPSPHYRQYPADCTNFVSQCLRAGGWRQVYGRHRDPNFWYYNWPGPASYTWSEAMSLESFITRSGRGRLVNDWRQLQPGDVIFADWGPDAIAPGIADGWSDHAMIVLSNNGRDILYAQHTSNKVRTLSSVQAEMYRSRFWYYKLFD